MKANDHGPQRSSLISANQAPAVPFGGAGGARPITRAFCRPGSWSPEPGLPVEGGQVVRHRRGLRSNCAFRSRRGRRLAPHSPGVPVSWHRPGHGVPPLLPPSRLDKPTRARAWVRSATPGGLGAGGAGPSELAIDPATHTLYVANGHNDNGPRSAGGTHCPSSTPATAAQKTSPAAMGHGQRSRLATCPGAIAVDQASDTVYVANVGDDTVSVFNGATCYAKETSGCSQHPATVPVGLGPQSGLRRPCQPHPLHYQARRWRAEHDGVDDQQRDV